ncbi:hypothetical protein [Methylocystis parvus]|uniref:hypothetical protein n=1 Tax=Methylocystis parvus TaxID=134 RepID=UPI003C734537
MLKGLSNYSAGRLLGMGMTLAVSAGYEQYINFTDFRSVEARVTSVRDRCYMQKRSGGEMVKSNEYDCASVESAVENNAIWRGASIVYDIHIDLQFVSPADGALHAASRDLTAWPSGKRVRKGDVLSIRASKSEPDIIKGI